MDREYKKAYRKEKVFCECGCVVTKGNYSTHLKCKKHKNMLEKKMLSYNNADIQGEVQQKIQTTERREQQQDEDG